ncbi:MAG: GEVED domain-containing protein, partial [Bacteroidota bacterium]
MKKIYFFFEKLSTSRLSILVLLFSFFISSAQTTIISPSGDGGFENGSTFAANGWTNASSANNPWVVGTAVAALPITGNSAYISNDGGVANAYTPANNASNFFWRDVTVPAGESVINLTFNWMCQGETIWDNWQVFYAPTSVVPVGSTTHPGSGATNVPAGIAGATWIGNGNLQGTVQTATIYLPASLAGTTFRLIFHWKNDGTGTQPPASIDNISLTSRIPGNFVSIATGNYGDASTWDAAAVPSPGDAVTVTAGHVVTVNAAGQGANNLIVNGTLAYGVSPTSFVVSGNLTVNPGGIFNLFNGTTGKTLNVAGNITNNGRIDTFVGTANQLVLNGSMVQTVSGTGVFGGTLVSTTATNEVGVIRQLICANTNVATPNIIWNVDNIRILGTLNTTGARIALGSNKIYIGNFASIGTHTSPVGTGFIGGSIGRFWTAAATGTAITAGTDPTNATSRYPFLSPTGAQRALYITRSAGGVNTTGYLTVAYNNSNSVTTGLSAVDGAYTVTDRADASWTISLENGYSTSTATHTLVIVANSLLNASTANVRVMNASTFVGTHQGGTITPGGQRIGITTAQLTGGAFYLGLNSAEISNSSITSGDWNNASTWSKGTVPVCADGVLISPGHTVTVNSVGNFASNTTISNTATLVVSSGDLTIGCTNNNTPLTNNGTLTVSGGTLTVNGNINNALATSVFNQSGGAIVLDGNSGIVATSVASATSIFNSESTNVNLIGGTLTFVDPHASVTSGSNLVIRLNNATVSTVSLAASPNHTTIFGDGISTTQAGVPAEGFRINNWASSAFLSLGSIEVNGNNATGRSVTSIYQFETNGNILVKNNSTLSLATLIVGGNLNVNAGGTFINTGGVVASVIASNTTTTLTFGPTTLAQTFTNNGTCSNLAVAPTANFTSLTVNNTNAAGITLASPFRVSAGLTFISGKVNTSNTNLLSHGTTTTAGTLTMPVTIPANTFVNGPLQRTIVSANTNATYILFPVGSGTTYAPASIAPTTTSVVEMKVESFGANTGTADGTIVNLSSTRRWEAPIVLGTVTNLNVRLSDSGVTNLSVPAVGAAAAGVYTGSFGTATYTAAANGTPNTIQSNSALALAGYTGFLSYADPNACTGTPAPGNTTTTSASVCPSVNFTLGLQNATTGTGVTYQWQSSPDGVTYADIVGQISTTTIVNQTAATYYQCIVTCTNSTFSTISTPIQINMSSFLVCYCASTYANGTGATGGDAITNVTLGTLNNSSNGGATATPSPYYTFYNAVTVPNLTQSSGQTMTISFGTDGSQFSGVWIDYNQDGDLLDAGEFVANNAVTAGASGTTTLNFTVPLGATLGNTLMRVRGGNDSVLTNTPCGASSSVWGETEDYIVNITPCIAPSISIQPVTQSVCEGTNVTLSVVAAGTGLTYQWKKEGVDILTATSDSYTITGALVADSGNYTVLVTGACGTSLSNVAVVTVTANSSLPTETISACDSYFWNANGTTYTVGGIYTSTVNCVTRTL